jgi:hypothetical protein
MNKIKNINVFNSQNYLNVKIDQYYYDIITLYNGLILEYLEYTYNTIKLKNKEYYKFIVIRGIKTITHIFKFLLLYTRNLKLIEYHIKKGYLYYIEFVGQISEDNNSYLQLNSKDAMLFVYKKTIFEINNDFRKKEYFSPNDNINHLFLGDLINNINSIIYYVCNKNTKYDNNYIILKKLINKISKIYIKSNYKNLLFDFIAKLEYYNKSEDIYLNYIRIFTNKMNKINKHKMKINIDLVRKRLYNSDDIINKKTPLKYINWLFNCE